MPFVDFPFCLKPVCQLVSVSAIAMLPKLIRPLGDLFLAAQVLVHVKYKLAFLLLLRLFHKFRFSRKVFNAPPQAMTWSITALTDFS